MVAKDKQEEYSAKEAAERRDAVIKRMIATPPKPHSEMKMGKSSPKQPKAKRAKKRVSAPSGRRPP